MGAVAGHLCMLMISGGRLRSRAARYVGCGRGICVKVGDEEHGDGSGEEGSRSELEEVEEFKYLGV